MAAPMIRPAQIDTLPYLNAENKHKYKVALQNLWNLYEQSAEGTPQHAEYESKLKAASARIMSELSNRTGGGAARPVSGGAPQRMAQQVSQQGGGVAGQTQAPAQVNAGQGNQGQAGQSGASANQMSPAIREQLSKINLNYPPGIQGTQAATYRQHFFTQAAENLKTREKAVAMGRQAQSRQQQLQMAHQEVPPALFAQIEQARKVMADCEARHKNLMAKNESYRQPSQQAAQGQGQGQAPPPVNGAPAHDMQRTTSNNAQSATIKQEQQRMSMSPPQPQGSFQTQPQQAQGGNVNAPVSNSQQQQQHMSQQPTPQQAHQTPQTATQPQPPQNFPQGAQQQYQQQPPQRPQMNTQLSQTQIPPQQQHQNTPTSAIPQSATQQQQNQRPQPLSQAAAMAQAANEYQRRQQMAPNQQHPGQQQQDQQQQQIPNGLPFNPPPSATQTTPNSAFPQQHQQQQPPPSSAGHLQPTAQTPNNKFPIKPTMQLNPQLTAPVPGPPSRPTMASQTMAQQPGLTRPQPFTLEGEGDRVLSKRKLDELVRQVTGGGSSTTDPTNADLSALSPEVETSILQLADDFVDNVLTSACRLAKLRPSQTLDLRDIQLVLERNYGIRVPGFALDEVRTVRKFQPAAGWQSKMQAVQTAKTLGGVGKGDA